MATHICTKGEFKYYLVDDYVPHHWYHWCESKNSEYNYLYLHILFWGLTGSCARSAGLDQNPPIGSANLQVLGVFFDQLYLRSGIWEKGDVFTSPPIKVVTKGNPIDLIIILLSLWVILIFFVVFRRDLCKWKGMVKSSGKSSVMGYKPHVVAEPFGGFW